MILLRLTSIVALLLLSSCSLLIDDETCSTDADCGAEQTCVPEGFCIDNSGCDTVIGSQRSDALMLGFISTFSGPNAEGGVNQRKVVELTTKEINANGGIQGLQGRELAFIACDDQADEQRAIDAANYLHRMGVPAILGPGFSTLVLAAAQNAAIPNGTFLISPSSTAVDIRDLDDNDLVWRVSSADTQQGNSLAYFALVLALQAQDASERTRVVTVHTQDIYGNGLRDSFEASLNAYTLAFAANLAEAGVVVEFDAVSHKQEGEAGDWNAEIDRIIEELEQKEPDMLLFVGYDGTADILSKLQKSPSLGKLPLLLTDGASSAALATAYQTESDLPDEVFGVQPGYRRGKAYRHFYELYGEPVLPAWTEFTYDAVYLLAYAAAGISPSAMDGAAFADSFSRFHDPEGRPINVGPDNLIPACQDMGDGLNLMVRGASGPLDFDVATGEPRSVGILRWTIGFSAPGEPGEIVECGLAMVHRPQPAVQTTYWCNALCMQPPESNDPCIEGYCERDDTCASNLCTGGEDCMPEHAPVSSVP